MVVVELKRDRTPRDVVAQALEYAAFAAGLDAAVLESILGEYYPDELMGLAEYHRKYFDQSEAVAFNKDQRIVIIGQQVTPEIRQTARFLGHKGIPVYLCRVYLLPGRRRRVACCPRRSSSVGNKRSRAGGPRRTAPLSRAEFLESCDDHGRAVYSRILDLVDRKGMLLRWGTTSFNIVADIGKAQEHVCVAGVPNGKFGQAIWTTLGSEYWGIRKTGVPAEVVEYLRKRAEQTRLFVPAGKELKCPLDRAFTDDEVEALVAWCESAIQAIREHAVPGGLPSG